VSKSKKMDDQMVRFRTNLAVEHPFWATLLFSLKIIPETNMPVIAATNCFKTIYYNPEKMKELNYFQIGFIFVHELLHIIYKHASRQQGREHFRWNYASDYMINLTIKDMGKWVEPFKVLCDESYRGMTSEEIYDALPTKLPNNGGQGQPGQGQPGQGQSGQGQPGPYGSMTPNGPQVPQGAGGLDTHLAPPAGVSAEDMAETIKGMVFKAYETAKGSAEGRGDIPGSLKRYIEGMKAPKVPWERALVRFVGGAFNDDDYSMTPYNRRYISIDQDLLLPTLHSPVLADMIIHIDSSGSVDEKLLAIFGAEAKKLHSIVEETLVIVGDCRVTNVVSTYDLGKYFDNFGENASELFLGGGGTDHRPIFQYIKEKGLNPTVFISLTDMDSIFPKNSPGYPVLWCVSEAQKKLAESCYPGWGELIYIPTDD